MKMCINRAAICVLSSQHSSNQLKNTHSFYRDKLIKLHTTRMGSAAGMSNDYDYVIVGSGPAGLQMSYLMKQAGVSHVVLEKSSETAAFTRRYPRHRTLISTNKRFNLFPEDDFNMRHDWNSLLCDDKDLLFTKYTTDLFPHADILVKYLEDFIERWGIEIRTNTEIVNVAKTNANGKEGFKLTASNRTIYTCKCVLMATGALKENIPDIPGIELTETYDSHTLDQSAYENKRVCIVGAKNSAFESANHLANHAAVIHFYTHGEVKMAWDTHFVGDLRAINNSIIDMYHLKSLHAIRTHCDINTIRKVIGPTGNDAYEIEFDMALPHWNPPGTGHFKTNYDKIIFCTGWKYVIPEMYNEDCRPEIKPDGRLPVLDEHWMSTVPHLYFMGTNMQARDNKSASGFIHGFRYNVRTLFHMLRLKYDGVEPPKTKFEKVDLQEMADFIIKRTSTTSALYQMNHGFLCDIICFHQQENRVWNAEYFYELPSAWVLTQARFLQQEKMWIISMGDNRNNFSGKYNPTEFSKPPDLKETNNKCTAFTEPVIKSYTKGQLKDILFLGGSLVVRHDKRGLADANPKRPYNILKNQLCRDLGIGEPNFDVTFFTDEVWKRQFTPWTKEQIEVARKKEEEGVYACGLKLFGAS